MAYVFGKLNNLIGQNDQGEEQGSAQNLVKRGGGDPAKSASSGDIKAPEQFSKSTFQNAGAIIERNKNIDQGAAANRIAAPAKGRLDQDFDQIQKDKTDYESAQAQKIKDTYRPVSQEIVEQGVRKGDNEAYNTLQRSLSPETYNVNAFQTLTPRSNSEIQSLAQGDTSKLLRQRASGPYTAGMAALDSLAFQRSGGAGQVASQLGQLQARNQNALRGTQGLTSQYQSQANQTREALANDTRGALGRLQADLRAQNTQALPGELERVRSAEEQAALKAAIDEVRSRAALAQGITSPDEAQRLVEEYARKNPLGLNQEAVAQHFPEGYVDADRAQSLSRLSALLGDGAVANPTSLENAQVFSDPNYRQTLLDMAQGLYLPEREDPNAAKSVAPIYNPTIPTSVTGDDITPIFTNTNTTGQQKTQSFVDTLGEKTGLNRLKKLFDF